MISQKQHLNKIRGASHETMKKNGHYQMMSEKGKKGREAYWKKWREENKKNKK